MDKEIVTEQHRWLQQLVGDWAYESTVAMGPGETDTTIGMDRVKALGEFWIIAEAEGEFPGDGPAKMVITLGYDPLRERFTGTFIHSQMSYLWHYDGELDGTRRILTLESSGPAMDGSETTARYRDVMEIVDESRRLFSSYALREDGKWHEFMSARYTRVA
ncbi:DUF1579 domain-containing protein [Massilia polaris]|nr:DUF1579 domain-containing protein [Massilia polaris]